MLIASSGQGSSTYHSVGDTSFFPRFINRKLASSHGVSDSSSTVFASTKHGVLFLQTWHSEAIKTAHQTDPKDHRADPVSFLESSAGFFPTLRDALKTEPEVGEGEVVVEEACTAGDFCSENNKPLPRLLFQGVFPCLAQFEFSQRARSSSKGILS